MDLFVVHLGPDFWFGFAAGLTYGALLAFIRRRLAQRGPRV